MQQQGVDSISTHYRGSDRRSRSLTAGRRIRRVELLGVLAGLALCAGLLPLGLMGMAAPQARHAQEALRNVWSIVFLAAGVLHIVRWRVTGETRTGIRGAAAVALGAVAAPTAAIAPLLSKSAATASLAPLSRTVAVLACLSLLTRAAHVPSIDTGARPLRTLVLTVVGGWTFIALMVVLADTRGPVDPGSSGWFGIECALALGWLLLAASTARRASLEKNASFSWLAIACTLMATAELFRGAAFVVNPAFQFFATGVQLVVASVVLVNAATDLTALLSSESRLVHLLSGTVRDTEKQLSADDRTEAARRHDARAVLAALRTASLVLDRYDETLDQTTRAQLIGSFTTELSRLEQMIDRRTDTTLETFSLDETLTPVLQAIHDVTVVGDISPALVRGRAEEFGGLVQTIVTTLGRRAVNAEVRLRVNRSTSGVQLICEASGSTPIGAYAGGRDTDDVSARKLRLQVAKRIMREQGGDVVVNHGWDGSMSVVLWLRPGTIDLVERADDETTDQRLMPPPSLRLVPRRAG